MRHRGEKISKRTMRNHYSLRLARCSGCVDDIGQVFWLNDHLRKLNSLPCDFGPLRIQTNHIAAIDWQAPLRFGIRNYELRTRILQHESNSLIGVLTIQRYISCASL